MVTPFLKSLSSDGGTLYTFPSVSKDLTRTFVSNDYEFKFSHFACLNIPDIKAGAYEEGMDKGLYLETFDDIDNNSFVSEVMNRKLAENFQNYIMNFETAILNGEGDDDGYDNDVMTTVSEKVFFNWLRKVGAIKFSNDTEEYETLADRTVQYIGDIDVVNTVEINGDTFEELYIHIPSVVGASSVVYFRDGYLTDNKNYLDKEYDLNGDNETCIIGRKDSVHPEAGFSKIPLVDIDKGRNAYIGDVGHTIDFRDTMYAGGDGKATMNSESCENFEFNAILIYYDFLEKTPDAKVKRKATNLYGIIFLEEITDINGQNFVDNSDTGVQGYIQRYPKKKETIYGNGNSFALKVDLKIDTIPDYTVVINKYDDPDKVVSMSLYNRMMLQLQKCIDLFYSQKKDVIDLRNRIERIESMIMGIDSVSYLGERVDRLYNLYDGMDMVDTSTLLGLIEVNSKKLDTIMKGGKDIKLQYDTDVLQPGEGISLDKDLNKVVISTDTKYAVTKVFSDSEMTVEYNEDNMLNILSSDKNCYLKLKKGENIAEICVDNLGDCDGNIDIFVDDTECKWSVGQSLKIVFTYDMDSLYFNYDSGIVIHIGGISLSIPGEKMHEKTVIEVICTNENKFIYLIR